MRFARLLAAACAAALLTSTAASADVKKKTQAELLQEALLNGKEPERTTEGSAEPTRPPVRDTENKTELEIAWENLSAGQIVTGIKQLDPDAPDPGKVRALRISYDKLTDSDKVLVTNIDRLAEAEETVRGAEENEAGGSEDGYGNTNRNTDKDAVKATEYTFSIENKEGARESLTLVLRYTTDDNADGRGDTPVVTLVAPDGIETPLTSKMPELRDSRTYMSFIWEQSFFQMDVAYAAEGSWTVRTDVPVTFMKSGYKGDQALITAMNEQGTDTGEEGDKNPAPQPEPVQSPAAAYLKLCLVFILFTALAGGYFLYFGKNRMPKAAGDRSTDDSPEPDDDEEDEIEAIRKEFQIQRQREEEEEAAILEEQRRREERQREKDERLMYTQMPEDDEELDEYKEGDTGMLKEKEEEPAPRFAFSKDG